MMKLSFSSLGCPTYSVEQIIETVKKLGYDGVELRTVKGTNNLWELPEFQGAALGETYRQFEAAGVPVAVVGSSASFASPDEAVRKEKMEDLRHSLEIAQALHCPYVRVFGGPIAKGQTREECVRQDIEGYREALGIADGCGVTLLFETHDDFSRSEWLVPLLKEFEGKAGAVWDILHPYRFGESIEDTARNLGPYVRHVHVKDSTEFSKDGFNLVLTGEGKMPIGEIVERLRGLGYGGYLSYEWEKLWHPEIQESEIAFPHYIEAMKQYR